MLQVVDFCDATGLNTKEVDDLASGGLIEGLWNLDGRLVGFFDDSLPSLIALREAGFTVRDTYDPASLRSYEETSDAGLLDEDDDSDGGSTWSMGWP